jgi:hypothetical protein
MHTKVLFEQIIPICSPIRCVYSTSLFTTPMIVQYCPDGFDSSARVFFQTLGQKIA